MLGAFLAAAFAASIPGLWFGPGPWYAALAKPAWNPPSSVFGPVWTAMYVLIAISGWLVWRRHGFSGARGAFALYLLQLALNAAWTFLFFGLHRPGLAFAEVLLLWLAIVATLVAFWRRRSLAGVLLAPYVGWVAFAAVLNFTIWRLNA